MIEIPIEVGLHWEKGLPSNNSKLDEEDLHKFDELFLIYWSG